MEESASTLDFCGDLFAAEAQVLLPDGVPIDFHPQDPKGPEKLDLIIEDIQYQETVAQPRSGKSAMSLRTRGSDQNAKAVAKYRQKVKQRYTALEEQRDVDAKRLREVEAELKRLSMQTRALQVLMKQGKNLTVDQAARAASMCDVLDHSRKGLTLSIFGQPRDYTHEQVLRMSLHDHFIVFRETSSRIAELLVQDDGSSQAWLEAQIKRILRDRHSLAAYICKYNPHTSYKLFLQGFLDAESGKGEPDWKAVQESLGLTPTQKLHITKAFKEFSDESERLWERRKVLQEELKTLNAESDHEAITKITTEMTQSLTEEHLLNVSVFVEFFLREQGFTPLQEAHLYLGSFPHMPRYGAVIKSIEI